MDINQGYSILKAVMLENGRGFALGLNPKAPQPFVTWACYDDEHGTELVRTAEALVNWHGDVKAIAEELHQHPNTVRYRMRKMKAVLGIPHEDDKVFINLLSLVFLPELG